MASNHKLTEILRGRTISSVASDSTSLSITLDDGSVMTIQKSPDCIVPVVPNSPVDKVRQAGRQLDIDLTNGSTFSVVTAEDTSSVVLRDAKGVFEYAD